MDTRHPTRAVTSFALAALAFASPLSAQNAVPRAMNWLDVQNMRQIGAPAPSPDGKFVLYTLSVPDWKKRCVGRATSTSSTRSRESRAPSDSPTPPTRARTIQPGRATASISSSSPIAMRQPRMPLQRRAQRRCRRADPVLHTSLPLSVVEWAARRSNSISCVPTAVKHARSPTRRTAASRRTASPRMDAGSSIAQVSRRWNSSTRCRRPPSPRAIPSSQCSSRVIPTGVGLWRVSPGFQAHLLRYRGHRRPRRSRASREAVRRPRAQR